MSVRMHEEDPFSAWLVRLQICSRRALRSSGRPRSDHEDIVGSVLADAVAAGPALMERYPNASVYASVRTAHAAESHYRRERVQRGEGARIHRNADGTMAPGRRVLSADSPAFGENGDDRSYYDRATSSPGFETDLVDSIVGGDRLRAILTACAGEISAQDLDLFILNRAYGHTVVELADFHRVTRETMSRRLSRISRVIESRVAWFGPPV